MKRIGLILLLSVASAPLARAAPADMNTLTCQDWLDAGEDEQEQMAAWLRGYLSGRGAGALFDLARVRADAAMLKRFCQGHLAAGLVSAAAAWGR
jgi:uncharacterized protein YdaL